MNQTIWTRLKERRGEEEKKQRNCGNSNIAVIHTFVWSPSPSLSRVQNKKQNQWHVVNIVIVIIILLFNYYSAIENWLLVCIRACTFRINVYKWHVWHTQIRLKVLIFMWVCTIRSYTFSSILRRMHYLVAMTSLFFTDSHTNIPQKHQTYYTHRHYKSRDCVWSVRESECLYRRNCGWSPISVDFFAFLSTCLWNKNGNVLSKTKVIDVYLFSFASHFISLLFYSLLLCIYSVYTLLLIHSFIQLMFSFFRLLIIVIL